MHQRGKKTPRNILKQKRDITKIRHIMAWIRWSIRISKEVTSTTSRYRLYTSSVVQMQVYYILLFYVCARLNHDLQGTCILAGITQYWNMFHIDNNPFARRRIWYFLGLVDAHMDNNHFARRRSWYFWGLADGNWLPMRAMWLIVPSDLVSLSWPTLNNVGNMYPTSSLESGHS